MFSSKRFIIVGFTFKSVIQFEFIFVYGMRYELMLSLSLFFFLHKYPRGPSQFVEKTSLSHFAPLPKSIVHIYGNAPGFPIDHCSFSKS